MEYGMDFLLKLTLINIRFSSIPTGGETRFDYVDRMVTPKLGRVAIWPSVLDEDPSAKDERTVHEAIPVVQGQKFGANAWLHLRNYTKGQEMGC